MMKQELAQDEELLAKKISSRFKDEDLKSQFADGAIPQPKNSPGEAGSGIPGIDIFQIQPQLSQPYSVLFTSIQMIIS